MMALPSYCAIRAWHLSNLQGALLLIASILALWASGDKSIKTVYLINIAVMLVLFFLSLEYVSFDGLVTRLSID